MIDIINIVHLTYGFELGGIETMLVNITNEQVKLGHQVHIVVINNNVNANLRKSLNSMVHFHCLERDVGSKNPYPYIKLNFLLRKLHVDIIHLHYASLANFIFIPSLVKRLCVTLHAMCSGQNSKDLYKSKKIFAISNVVKEDIKMKEKLDSEVVSNGINISSIKCSERKNNKIFHIVQVSRLAHEIKGQHILIRSIKQLVDKNIKHIHVDFIGDGESKNYLMQLTDKLNLNEYINFLGSKDQLYIFENLCNYDLFVQPSIWEGFGLTVAEAMAARVPVLVSENQGPLEVIDYDRCGYSFKNGDPEDCANLIELFINRQNDLGKINHAYDRAVNLYNVEVTAKTYLNKYKELMAANR